MGVPQKDVAFQLWLADYDHNDDGQIEFARNAWRAALEWAAQICDQIEVKQENDNGAANTGGAAECATAIRRQLNSPSG